MGGVVGTLRGSDLRVVVGGGGTAGHIYPALAVAEVLKREDAAQIAKADQEPDDATTSGAIAGNASLFLHGTSRIDMEVFAHAGVAQGRDGGPGVAAIGAHGPGARHAEARDLVQPQQRGREVACGEILRSNRDMGESRDNNASRPTVVTYPNAERGYRPLVGTLHSVTTNGGDLPKGERPRERGLSCCLTSAP